jgi:competence protein ComEC
MKKNIFIGLALIISLIFAFTLSLPDGKLHIIFCDVGQGDAAYIRTPSNQDILIDGGPNEKVLDCLGKYMPFYDRTIDVLFLSHPQKDHFGGLESVIERYTVKYFVMSPIAGRGKEYERLIKKIEEKRVPVKILYTGDKFSLGKVGFDILWPEREWVEANLATDLSDLSNLSDLSVLGIKTVKRDPNEFSYYLYLSYGQFDALFTGDGDSKIQKEIEKDILLMDIEVLKFPHHGSKTGLLPDFLEKIKPELAVISVGKNSYGHPSQEALNLLQEHHVEIKRTDQDGNIQVVSDGKSWEISQ